MRRATSDIFTMDLFSDPIPHEERRDERGAAIAVRVMDALATAIMSFPAGAMLCPRYK